MDGKLCKQLYCAFIEESIILEKTSNSVSQWNTPVNKNAFQ